MPSIEILVEDSATDLKYLETTPHYKFDILVDCPPISHRDPSIWQSDFRRLGGQLVHLGNKGCVKSDGPFFAYNLIEDNENATRFRIKKEFLDDILRLLNELTLKSRRKIIHFTIDWQAGPKAGKVYKRTMTLDTFKKRMKSSGFRMNCWVSILGHSQSNIGAQNTQYN